MSIAMSVCDDTSVTESSHDENPLPFALVEPENEQSIPSRGASEHSSPVTGKVLHDSQVTVMPYTSSLVGGNKSSCDAPPSCSMLLNGQVSHMSSNSQPPQMVTSSVLSSPTDDGESQTSSTSNNYYENSSLLLPDNHSHYLDAAASLLFPRGSILGASSSTSPPCCQNSCATTSDHAVRDSTTSRTDPPIASRTTLPTTDLSAETQANHPSPTVTSFSQLLNQANNQSVAAAAPLPGATAAGTNPTPAAATATATAATSTAHLPPLLEEDSFAATSSSMLSSSYFTLPDACSWHQDPQQQPERTVNSNGDEQHSPADNWISRNLFPLSSDVPDEHSLQQTILPAVSDASLLREHRRQQNRLQQQQQQFQRNVPSAAGGNSRSCLASLAGATARMTSDVSFDVSIDLVVPNCTAQDVMDILGNPNMLHLWHDAVSSLVITSISEGAQDAVNRRRRRGGGGATALAPFSDLENNSKQQQQQQQQEGTNREYEGEWIEATTAQLMAPVNSMSCIYSTSRMLAVALGFPTYGKVTMFVERQQGRVGLTMGPLPGGYEILHRIKVETVSGVDRRIRMTDQVLLQSDFDSSDTHVNFCGIFSGLERCFLPSPEDYMDQVLNSMARLRFLVENGENADHRIPQQNNEEHVLHTEPSQENGGILTAPLLSA